MSEQLRNEVFEAVRNGDTMFLPSEEVRAEAMRFVRPRSLSLTSIKIDHGSGMGRNGDGRLIGVGISPTLMDLFLVEGQA